MPRHYGKALPPPEDLPIVFPTPDGGVPLPRGYDAQSYALALSLLDPGGSMDGSLVVEVVGRRDGLTQIDFDAIGLQILGVAERSAPRRFTI